MSTADAIRALHTGLCRTGRYLAVDGDEVVGVEVVRHGPTGALCYRWDDELVLYPMATWPGYPAVPAEFIVGRREEVVHA